MQKGYTDRMQLVFHDDGVTKIQVITIEECQERLKEGTLVLQALAELQDLVRDTPA